MPVRYSGFLNLVFIVNSYSVLIFKHITFLFCIYDTLAVA